ncbi:sensor histidine kinase [Streptomyces qinzhouensis]|uniref:histidine kinase n=1 Tax=Streptomyces qinzhouensis TaxID=2599401 RepID=A0A5B8IHB4_9ACTN|nr:histidine kinase [Streptomyces qinzhouensis]QDY77652.1 sensor histidine kinase [Streptomyces qinzhouensis]
MTAPTPPRPGRDRRPAPTAVTALSWAGALAYPVLLYLAVRDEPELTGTRLLPPLLLAVLPFPLLRRQPLPALALMLAGSFTALVTADRQPLPWMAPGAPRTEQFGYLQALLTDIAVGCVAAARPRRTATAAAALTFTVQVAAVVHQRAGSEVLLSHLLLLALVLALAWMSGHLVRERRDHAETVRTQTAAQAVMAERLRIARELHDMVAHSIGIIAIQAGTGRRVIHTQPDEARQALAVIETTSRDTLAGLRRMLGALRRADPEGVPLTAAPGLGELERLAETTRDGGVRVDLDRLGERRDLPAEVELSAFRIVQEAITNVVRHAGTDRCRVVVDYREDELVVEITDDGRGAAAATAGTGYGLTGMRERAVLLHGRFTAGPRPGGGFRVTAALPVPAARP